MLIAVILIALVVAAAVVCLAAILIARRLSDRACERLKARASESCFAVLAPLVRSDDGAGRGLTESWKSAAAGPLRALAAGLRVGSPRVRRSRRLVLQQVLEELGHDFGGEASARITYLFERLGFVERAVVRLKDRRWWVRAEASRELCAMRSRIALPPLVGLLRDPEEEVRREAARALIATLGVGDALGTILEHVPSISRWFAMGLSDDVERAGAAAIPHLLAALDARSSSVRLFAIRMLPFVAGPEAVPALLERLPRWQGEEFREALVALGQAGDERALPALLVQLDAGDARMKETAARALGTLGLPEAVEPLVSAVLMERLPVRLAAAEALAAIDGPGMDGLRALLEAPAPTARAVALDVLDRHAALEGEPVAS